MKKEMYQSKKQLLTNISSLAYSYESRFFTRNQPVLLIAAEFWSAFLKRLQFVFALTLPAMIPCH